MVKSVNLGGSYNTYQMYELESFSCNLYEKSNFGLLNLAHGYNAPIS